MSQMQTFEFLSTLASLKLPETVSDKQDYFSDADAAAWAKEAEAAGITDESQEETLANGHELSEQSSNRHETANEENTPTNLELDENEGALAYSSTGQLLANDIWLDSIQENENADTFIKSQLSDGTAAEVNAEEIAAEMEGRSFEADVESMTKNEAMAVDENEMSSEGEMISYAKSLQDDGVRIIEDAKFEAPVSDESSVNEFNTSDNLNSEKEAQSDSGLDEENTLVASSSEAVEAAVDELFEDMKQAQRLETSLTEAQSDPELSEAIEISSSGEFDNPEVNFQNSKGMASGELLASKMVTKIAKAYAAMQARANAIASQQSLTLRGSEFGGQLDIKIRNTGRGLDLTLMPQALSQAGALTGSLRQIRDLLNKRGIETQRVQLNTDKLTDFWGLNRERFVDTTFFSGMQNANDNLTSLNSTINQMTSAVADHTNQGELV